MADREQLHALIDRLPDSEISAAKRFLEFLTSQEAPVDGGMLARIDEARAHPSAGIAHEDVCGNSGFEVRLGACGSGGPAPTRPRRRDADPARADSVWRIGRQVM